MKLYYETGGGCGNKLHYKALLLISLNCTSFVRQYEGTWQTCGKCHYENNAEDALFCGGCGAKLDGEYSEP